MVNFELWLSFELWLTFELGLIFFFIMVDFWIMVGKDDPRMEKIAEYPKILLKIPEDSQRSPKITEDC